MTDLYAQGWRWSHRFGRMLPPEEDRPKVESIADFLKRGGKIEKCPAACTQELRDVMKARKRA